MLNLFQSAFNIMAVDDVLAWSVIAVSIVVLIILIGINIYVSRIRKQIRDEELNQDLEKELNSNVTEIALSEEEIQPEEEIIKFDNDGELHNEENVILEENIEENILDEKTADDKVVIEDLNETQDLNLALTLENESENINETNEKVEFEVENTVNVEKDKKQEEQVKVEEAIEDSPNELYVFELVDNQIKTKVKRLNIKK